jgi:hypothetical protein
MLSISDYSKFFMKRTFELPKYKQKKLKKKEEPYDYLFYEIYRKINNLDYISFNTYNEKQVKTKLAEEINKLKIKKKDFIMNNLMYDFNIHLITLNAICVYYKINLLFVKDQIYIKMFHNEDSPILVMDNNFKFLDYTESIYDTHYEIINLEKPMNCMSYYKLDELIQIAIKLQLNYEKIKKQILYDSIYNNLVKLNIFKID